METMHLAALVISTVAVIILAIYTAYSYSEAAIIRRILRDGLESPRTLHELIMSESWRQSHKFIETLHQEIDYLDKFFVYHNHLP